MKRAPRLIRLLLTMLILTASAHYARAAAVTAVAVSLDRKTVFLGDAIGNISAWSIENGEKLWSIRGRGASIYTLGPMYRWVIAVDGPNLIVMVHEGARKTISILDYMLTIGDEPSMTATAALNPNGTRLVLAGTHFAEMFALDTFTFVEKKYQRVIKLKSFESVSLGPLDQGLMRSYPSGEPINPSVLAALDYADLQDAWKGCAWCATRIVAVSAKGHLAAWDIDEAGRPASRSEQAVIPKKVEPTFVRQVASNRDADRSLRGVACARNDVIATVSAPGRYGSLQVWSVNGELQHFAQPPRANPRGFDRVAFSDDGKWIVTSDQSGYVQWKLTSSGVKATARIEGGERPLQIGTDGTPMAAVDGSRVVIAADDGAALLDCASGKVVRSFGAKPTSLKIRPLSK